MGATTWLQITSLVLVGVGVLFLGIWGNNHMNKNVEDVTPAKAKAFYIVTMIVVSILLVFVAISFGAYIHADRQLAQTDLGKCEKNLSLAKKANKRHEVVATLANSLSNL